MWEGDPCEMVVEDIGGTQTFAIGSPLQKYSGYVILAQDCASGASDKAIYGFAYALATAPTTGDDIYVAKINVNQLWAMWVSSSGNDSAAAATIKGNAYGHAVESSSPYAGYMTLDLGYTTYVSMVVEGILSEKDSKIVASASTSPGVAIVRFTAAALDQLGA